ncbi:PREDICTED: uncharacterized protein DDB_G0292186 [Nicotiana attenuata]|uniref:Uncharacterized protein n=1 Tax=Nicotiana attenuata TaxID=49451 RepID=A0A1J6IM16_NICAT|nr:PREDICTED: uncharacterized protein DDB_G0292186 [Nicotiana attenuata]OIT05762.1 hypothetical protein A4A49_07400 [Nicotiana attenuata]
MATEVSEWEVINDDGFIYKRRKTQQLQVSSSTTSASTSAAPARPNPAVAELKRKKRVLLRISERFDKEIEELEAWEKTLNDLKVNSKIQQQQTSDPQPQPQPQPQPEPQPQLQSSSGFSSVDQLLSQAEAREDVIRNILKRCDVAEALCTAAEERVKQPFFDLPIWAHSPRSLIKSLGEE